MTGIVRVNQVFDVVWIGSEQQPSTEHRARAICDRVYGNMEFLSSKSAGGNVSLSGIVEITNRVPGLPGRA